MVRNGDLICYRETEVQAYARLTAELDPTLLVAWNLSQWLEESSNPTAKDIQRIVAVQDTFLHRRVIRYNPLRKGTCISEA